MRLFLIMLFLVQCLIGWIAYLNWGAYSALMGIGTYIGGLSLGVLATRKWYGINN